MRLRDLLQLITYDPTEIELRSELNLDMEVRIASQPQWPFEHAVDDAMVVQTAKPYLDEEEADRLPEEARQEYENDCGNGVYDDDEKCEDIFYIVEGSQLRYLPSNVKSQIGWR